LFADVVIAEMPLMTWAPNVDTPDEKAIASAFALLYD